MARRIVSWVGNGQIVSPDLSKTPSIVSVDSILQDTSPAVQGSPHAAQSPAMNMASQMIEPSRIRTWTSTSTYPWADATDGSFVRHPKYFFKDGNVAFLVDYTLYCVHRYFFSRDSIYFSTRFTQLDIHDHEALPTIISLGDIERKDFDAFLSVLYPENFEENDLCYEEWKSVLHLSTRWSFSSIRKLALRSIEPPTPHDRLLLARAYSVDDWAVPALSALCERTTPLTLSEALQMNIEDVVLVSTVREHIRDRTIQVDAAEIPLCVEAEQLVALGHRIPSSSSRESEGDTPMAGAWNSRTRWEEAEAEARAEAQEAIRQRLDAKSKERAEAEEKVRQEAEKARLEAEEETRKDVEEKARLEAEKARKDEEEMARLEAERARKDAEEMARLEAEKAHEDAEEMARAEKALTKKAKKAAKRREAEAMAEAEAKAKAAEAEARAKAQEAMRQRLDAEAKAEEARNKAKEDAENKAKAEEEAKAKEAANREAEAEAAKEAKAIADAEAEANAAEEAKAIADAEAEAKAAEEAKAIADAEAKAAAEKAEQGQEASTRTATAKAEAAAAEEAKREKERRRFEKLRVAELRAKEAEEQVAKKRAADRAARLASSSPTSSPISSRSSGGGWFSKVSQAAASAIVVPGQPDDPRLPSRPAATGSADLFSRRQIKNLPPNAELGPPNPSVIRQSTSNPFRDPLLSPSATSGTAARSSVSVLSSGTTLVSEEVSTTKDKQEGAEGEGEGTQARTASEAPVAPSAEQAGRNKATAKPTEAIADRGGDEHSKGRELWNEDMRQEE